MNRFMKGEEIPPFLHSVYMKTECKKGVTEFTEHSQPIRFFEKK